MNDRSASAGVADSAAAAPEPRPRGETIVDGDGPWRVAETVTLIVRASSTAPAIGWASPGAQAALRAGGFPVRAVIELGQGHDGDSHDLAVDDPATRPGPVDQVWIDGDVAIDPASLVELRRVAASDPMIAIVVPRFVAAEGPAGARDPEPAHSSEARELFRTRFPAMTPEVWPDGRCLYLKGAVWAECGGDPIGKPPDWDGFALAANRFGFRVVVANHAFAGVPSRAGPDRDQARLSKLRGRYPHAAQAVASVRSGATAEAEALLAALPPRPDGRRDVAFDLEHVGRHRSGTTELVRALVGRATRAWADRFVVHVVARRPVFDLHFGGERDAPQRVDPDDPRRFSACIRLGQPFVWREVDRVARRAPALVFFMLDTIALDCLHLAHDELDAIWRFLFGDGADGILFNSAFTGRQFARRFPPRPGLPCVPSLHSTDVRDYLPVGEAVPPPGRGSGVLVVGNTFTHKHLAETVRVLAAAGLQVPIVALGLREGAVAGVRCIPSGGLDETRLAALYREASVVVYPSLYEGFGFPILHALAHRRPVFARRLPPFEEIAGVLPEAANLRFFDTDAALPPMLSGDLAWRDTRAPVVARSWDDAVADLGAVLEEALAGVDYDRTRRRVEFLRGRVAWMRRKRFEPRPGSGPAPGADEIEHAAAVVGGLVQDLMARAGRAVPGTGAALRGAIRLARAGWRP